ncbi:hypothetical protein HYDPIDRAFT_88780 [Hydnomerulius pinastri MD-312]|uniref:Transposase Tc1-like domain-containing protein n=1 Tax=Hydnomerulius pinastri MD-312 TaxID=994086 RepID=A0A0C9W2N3_9AGAM|nr:hypothetical protein HYDPIDRAFT_88780 [Hydnomerulius pinastri MD-312]
MVYRNRRHIPCAAKEQVVTMLAHMKPSQIACATGINARTIQRTMELWWKTGSVQRTPIEQGRKRKLNALDIAFLEGCIERTPDIYVSELQHELKEACGIDVSEPTITRALCRRGFSRKEVCLKYISLLITDTSLGDPCGN